MPRGDGTGPQGQGPKTGKGLGKCNPQSGVFTPQGQNPMGSGKGKGQGMGKKRGRGAGTGSGSDGRNRQ